MQVLSNPTLGLVVEVAAAQFSGSDLKTMLMRADLWHFAEDKAMTNKQELVRSRVLSARNYVDLYGDKEVAQALLNFVRMLVERTVRTPGRAPGWFAELCEALLADGYELRWEPEEEGDDWDPPRASHYQILPTDVSPIPLGPQISALEAELRARGYDEALNHYQQAAEAFARHDHEAANSQLRTTLESIVVRLAEDHAGYVRPPKTGGGGPAIKHLAEAPALTAADGGDMLKGLWAMSHTKGSHPGRSDADETRFRLHAITATARLLLHRFPACS